MQCSRLYQHKGTLLRHLRVECNKNPMHECPHCPYRSKQKAPLKRHVVLRHPNALIFSNVLKLLEEDNLREPVETELK